jgi:hypothetical protein
MTPRAHPVTDLSLARRIIAGMPLKHRDATPQTAVLGMPASEEVALCRAASH